MSDDLKRAGDDLSKELTEAFEQLPLIPDGEIASIHSAGYCEDACTFHLMLEMKDGSTMLVAACPGEVLSVSVQ